MAAVALAQTAMNTFSLAGMGAEAPRRAESGTDGITDVAVSIPEPAYVDPVAPGAAPPGHALAAPYPETFPRYPQSWYLVFPSDALARGAVRGVTLCGRSLVVFRGADGRIGALAARCPHLGTDLARGRVVGDSIECPHHRFRFDRAGTCRQNDLRNVAYPVEERFGAAFVFLGARSTFALPSFGEGVLISAPRFRWNLETQWYMVGANAFDARHFAIAHGRRLITPPQVRTNGPSLEVAYEYAIEGHGWLDRAIRLVSGTRVEFHVAAWGGNFLLVQARFVRDHSFGVVVVEPTGPHTSTVSVIVSARRSGARLEALLRDWLRVHAKRIAIRKFLRDDVRGLRQLDYVGGGLRPGDETLAAFLRWASAIPEG